MLVNNNTIFRPNDPLAWDPSGPNWNKIPHATRYKLFDKPFALRMNAAVNNPRLGNSIAFSGLQGASVEFIKVVGPGIAKNLQSRGYVTLADLLKDGNNEIEIHYTTVLANYCRSLKDNPVAQHWTKEFTEPVATGLQGPVNLLKMTSGEEEN